MTLSIRQRAGFRLQSGLELMSLKLARQGSPRAARAVLRLESRLAPLGGLPVIGPLFHFKAGGISLATLDGMIRDSLSKVAVLDYSGIKSIEPSHIGLIPLEQIRLLTAEQIGFFTPKQTAEFTLAQLTAMTPKQLAAIGYDQIEALAKAGRLADQKLDEPIVKAILASLQKGNFARYYKVLLTIHSQVNNR